MNSKDVRRIFLDFFAKKGHKVVPSSSLIPHGDPTLLFTNAGMNQFKNVFLGLEKRDYSRAVTIQKCVRAGGKHNDLENVGKTARHLTYFEMLGNFSFGDYFKKDATAWAWELVTEDFKMSPELLWISIHYSDDQAFELWNKNVGIPADRIVRLGDKDNFWAMGDTGPCGPCSEIYYDQGTDFPFWCGRPECNIECDCGRYTEFWNLVFMQYNRNDQGELIPLPNPSIDTGAGLERVTSLLQGVFSVFETDLMFPVIQAASENSGIAWKASERTDIAFRVLADHARAATFLISEGITPSNEGRGYVLRRIIRRALRYGRALHFEDAFLYKLTGIVVDSMKDVYPELTRSQEYVAQVCKSEEEKFKSVVENATAQLEEVFANAEKQGRHHLEGREIFKLYDTFGLPVDFVQEMANEKKFELDLAGFEEEMSHQRETARAAWKGDLTFEAQEIYRNLSKSYQTTFTGYWSVEEKDCEIIQILNEFRPVLKISAGEEGELILNKTPFYAESGGQLGDRGVLSNRSGTATVLDTQTPVSGLIVHKIRMESGYLEMGDFLTASVDPAFRQSVRKNHTATHLLHAALRRQLGEHVKQSGSLVAPDRLRFDFTHYAGLKPEEMRRLELEVNEKVITNLLVDTKVTTMEEAVAQGAMALFGEKYGDQVRMVSIEDYSKELCGGTHCNSTGEVGAFLISRESSTAAGIRRIEALTGVGALQYVQQERALVEQLTSALKISSDEVLERVQELLDRNKKLEKELDHLREKQSMVSYAEGSQEVPLKDKTFDVQGFSDMSQEQLGKFVDRMKGKDKVIIAFSLSGDTVVSSGNSDVDANTLFKRVIGPELDGGGGGRKDFAKGKLKKLKGTSIQDAIDLIVSALKKHFS